jgi:PAS domain S-box-containing protein
MTGMPRIRRALSGAILVVTLALGSSPASSQSNINGPRRTVLILYSIPQDVPGLRELSTAVTDVLEHGSREPVDLYGEYTGLDRFSGDAYESSLVSLYQQKYSNRKVDLMIAVGASALQFVVARKLLPGVPIVTCYVGRSFLETARTVRPEVTGALPPHNVPKTLDLMLALYPRTRRIHVVLGASQYEREQAEQGRRLFKSFENRVELDYLNDLTLEQLEAKLAHLPDEELVLFGSLLRDASGRDFSTNEALSQLARASRRPIFGVVSEDLGDGIVGGILISMELSGRAAGELALRVLSGQPAGAIPLLVDAGAAPMFDWRQLERFGIAERDLPPQSLIRMRRLGLWDLYAREIGGGIAIIVLEGLLVAGLVVQLRRRRRVERRLAQAETRYRTVADFTHDFEFWQRTDGSFEYVSPACERVIGHSRAELESHPELLEALVVDEDRPAFRAYQVDALEGRQQMPIEYRIETCGGEVRWLEQANNPVELGGGLAGTRGSIRDVTSRKKAELELKQAYQEIGDLKDRLEAENTLYREKIQTVEGSSELIGGSDAMKYLLYRIGQVAPAATTVLIQGETGTGKELVAEAIHRRGSRRARALVKVNCAALPPSLAESELFGHEKGAFTGAQAQRKGRFELADGATLFLDEVGELSPEIQAKLLRVLQDGEFQRVGGDRTIKVDVRVIAATNRDLARDVVAGRFREDLLYRLDVFPITVAPLRKRVEDIPMLAQLFVAHFCEKLGRPVLDLPKSVVQALQAYAWPGNVRELQNVIERAVLVSDGTLLRLADSLKANTWVAADDATLQSLADAERSHILRVLEACSWKVEGQKGAAEILGLKPSTLRSRMAKLEIEREK